MQTTFSDPGSNVSRTTFLEFFDRYAAADQAVAEAVGDRKGLRAEMKGAGIDMAAFDEGWAEGDAERRSAQAETGPEAEPKRRGRPPRAGGRSRKRTGNGAEA
jgi:hypothetical protein